jgi:transcriptional regulator with XRE-family HTH domain
MNNLVSPKSSREESDLQELAAKIGGTVSYAALSKYEHGLMQPSSSVLISLSRVLSQSPKFFFRPFRLELTEVRFRMKSMLGASAEKSFLERARDHFERYEEVEEWVGDVRRFEAPFAAHCSTLAKWIDGTPSASAPRNRNGSSKPSAPSPTF